LDGALGDAYGNCDRQWRQAPFRQHPDSDAYFAAGELDPVSSNHRINRHLVDVADA
jgi:hypothetical protein